MLRVTQSQNSTYKESSCITRIVATQLLVGYDNKFILCLDYSVGVLAWFCALGCSGQDAGRLLWVLMRCCFMMQLVKHISLWWQQNVWPLYWSLVVPFLWPLGLTIFSISAATLWVCVSCSNNTLVVLFLGPSPERRTWYSLLVHVHNIGYLYLNILLSRTPKNLGYYMHLSTRPLFEKGW